MLNIGLHELGVLFHDFLLILWKKIGDLQIHVAITHVFIGQYACQLVTQHSAFTSAPRGVVSAFRSFSL